MYSLEPLAHNRANERSNDARTMSENYMRIEDLRLSAHLAEDDHDNCQSSPCSLDFASTNPNDENYQHIQKLIIKGQYHIGSEK